MKTKVVEDDEEEAKALSSTVFRALEVREEEAGRIERAVFWLGTGTKENEVDSGELGSE